MDFLILKYLFRKKVLKRSASARNKGSIAYTVHVIVSQEGGRGCLAGVGAEAAVGVGEAVDVAAGGVGQVVPGEER